MLASTTTTMTSTSTTTRAANRFTLRRNQRECLLRIEMHKIKIKRENFIRFNLFDFVRLFYFIGIQMEIGAG